MILIINGPNLNLLGQREPRIYGSNTYQELESLCIETASFLKIDIQIKQSNHEGVIIDWIQNAYNAKGLIINPAAYSHTSIAILDALKCLHIPIIEVHLTDLTKREKFRQHSLTSLAAKDIIMGKGIKGYVEAIHTLVSFINK